MPRFAGHTGAPRLSRAPNSGTSRDFTCGRLGESPASPSASALPPILFAPPRTVAGQAHLIARPPTQLPVTSNWTRNPAFRPMSRMYPRPKQLQPLGSHILEARESALSVPACDIVSNSFVSPNWAFCDFLYPSGLDVHVGYATQQEQSTTNPVSTLSDQCRALTDSCRSCGSHPRFSGSLPLDILD